MSTHREPGTLKTGGGDPSGCGFRAGHLNRQPSRGSRERRVSAKGFMGVHKGRDHTAQFEWYRELMLIQPVSKKNFGADFLFVPNKCGVWSVESGVIIVICTLLSHIPSIACQLQNKTPHSTLYTQH